MLLNCSLMVENHVNSNKVVKFYVPTWIVLLAHAVTYFRGYWIIRQNNYSYVHKLYS